MRTATLRLLLGGMRAIAAGFVAAGEEDEAARAVMNGGGEVADSASTSTASPTICRCRWS